MRRTFRLGRSTTLAGAALVALLLPTAAHADRGHSDYTPAASVGDAATPTDSAQPVESARLVKPLVRGTNANGTAGRVTVPDLAAGQAPAGYTFGFASAPNPVAKRMSGSITAADGFNHVVCKYNLFTSVSAAPPPPARGNQYGIARVNGRSGYTQAFDSQGGAGQTSHTSAANTTFDLAIPIPINWPQPSQINGYVNPSLLGGHRVDTNNSPLTFSQSSATAEEVIRFGWLRDNSNFMETLFDITTSRNDGADSTEFWTWPAFTDGTAFFSNIDSSAAHTYHYRVTSDTKATSGPIFGAGAAAQIDYGSEGIDAPSLAAGLFFRANDSVGFLIEYLMPPGWTTSC